MLAEHVLAEHILAEHSERIDSRYISYRGCKLLAFAGGDYHGFARDPEMLAIARQVMDEKGLNTSASRSTTGNDPAYENAEAIVADFFAAPAASICSNGYLANIVLLQAVAASFDSVVIDEFTHASSRDALSLVNKPMTFYRHHNLDDLQQKLVLTKGRVLVISDAVQGMRGDIAPLPGLVEIVSSHPKGALLIDESHSFGVLGQTGRGVFEHFGIDRSLVGQEIIMRTGSLGKALGSLGGLVLGSVELQQSVRCAPAFLGAGQVPILYLKVATRAIQRLIEQPESLRRLQQKAKYLKQSLFDLGCAIEVNNFPVIGLELQTERDVIQAKNLLLERGIYPSLIGYPGLPQGFIKFALNARHTDADIEILHEALEQIAAMSR